MKVKKGTWIDEELIQSLIKAKFALDNAESEGKDRVFLIDEEQLLDLLNEEESVL